MLLVNDWAWDDFKFNATFPQNYKLKLFEVVKIWYENQENISWSKILLLVWWFFTFIYCKTCVSNCNPIAKAINDFRQRVESLQYRI